MPALVQAAANSISGSSLTVTLGTDNPSGPSPGPTTAGNCLVALIGDAASTTNGTPSAITLGGSADNWAQKAIQGTGSDHAIVAGWADFSCAGGQTSVVITTTGGVSNERLMAWVFEFSGLTGTLDASSGGANTFASTWTSGTSGTTAQPSEVAFGITCGSVNGGGAGTLTGPSSPWVNGIQQQVVSKAGLAGYQILSSTGTVSYAGSSSPTTTNDTLVFTLIAGAAPVQQYVYQMRMMP